METINLDKKIFKYEITYKAKKNISMRILKTGFIEVRAPLGVSKSTVESIIRKQKKWVIEREECLKKISEDKWYYYLGKKYGLKINYTNSSYCNLKLEDNNFVVDINKGILKEKRKKIIDCEFKKFYKEKALQVLKERTNYYGAILGFLPNKIFIKSQKTLWGSCSSKGNINYNYKLIMAPLYIIDYIVVHELCHFKHMDHSKNFWDLVSSIMPDCKDRRAWLKENGSIIMMKF